ncbi:LCP family protein [Paenibacillus cremeus]|uniref:LytR family transcriptional regulator n=1 Tax=Paenibacillus cremeus TaxID=2163881 RepID=A0A559K3I7_9BACL|nr:LCP family protein [Paenibacillus cremeus]TVY06705.1 LytR family transcriptional regulator [Paenibacillus cremeus]
MVRSRRKPKRRKVLQTALLCLSLLGVGAAGFSGYLVYKANHALNQMSLGAPGSLEPGASGDGASPIPSSSQPGQEWRPMTFLLTGLDNREGSDGSMNTDVLMLATLNPKTSSATIVSIPRDVELKPKELGLSPHKINYFYAYYYNQNQVTALSKTKALFSQMFDLPIDYMVMIDFNGFREVVDELGGLELDVDMDMKYVDDEDGTNINLKKGQQKLSGKQTLDFLRYRKSNRGTEESSDLERNMRQQQVLSKLIDKLTSFSGVSQWGGVLDIAGRNVKTDIPSDQLRTFVLSLQKLKPATMEFIHLDGEWESPYIVPKESDLRQAIAALKARREDGGVQAGGGLGSVSGSGAASSGATVTSATYDRLRERFGVEPDPPAKKPVVR